MTQMKPGAIVCTTSSTIMYKHRFVTWEPAVVGPMREALGSDTLYREVIEEVWDESHVQLIGRNGMYVCGFDTEELKVKEEHKTRRMAVVHFEDIETYAVFSEKTLELPEEHDCPRCGRGRTEKGRICWWCGAP